MKWYTFIAYFFGGAFLVNAVPHFTSGVLGAQVPVAIRFPSREGRIIANGQRSLERG